MKNTYLHEKIVQINKKCQKNNYCTKILLPVIHCYKKNNSEIALFSQCLFFFNSKQYCTILTHISCIYIHNRAQTMDIIQLIYNPTTFHINQTRTLLRFFRNSWCKQIFSFISQNFINCIICYFRRIY